MEPTKSKSPKPVVCETNTHEISVFNDSPHKPSNAETNASMDIQTNSSTATTATAARPSKTATTTNRILRYLRSLPPFRVILTVAACVVIEATLGVAYTSGNLMPYVTSYLRNVTGETSLDYGRMLWGYNTCWMVTAATISLLGLVERRIHNRIYIFSGILGFAGAFFGTYWALQDSFISYVITYGVLQGLAQAILFPSALNLGLRWFPHRKGLVGGITMAGYGGGSFAWNQVVTMWINPDNIQPDFADGENMYFTQLDLLHRVPTCFLLLGGILTTIQLLCFVCLSYPDSQTSASKVNRDTDTQEKLQLNSESGEKQFQAKSESEPNSQGKIESSSEDGIHLLEKFHPSSESGTLSEENFQLVSEAEMKSQEKCLLSSESQTLQQEKFHLSPESGTKPQEELQHNSDSGIKSQEDLQSKSDFADATRKVENVKTEGLNNPGLEPDSELVGSNTRPGDVNVEGYRSSEKVKGSGSSDDVENGRECPTAEDERDVNEKEPINGVSLQTEVVRKTPEYSLLQIVTSRALLTLWLNNLMLDFCFIFIVAFYKTFGQTFIPNDHLLALVGSFASVFNAVGRPIWGLVADKIGYLPTLLIIESILAVMVATFLTTELAGSSAMFFAWVCTIYACFSGIYALQGPVIFILFGSYNFIFSLGLVTSTGLVSTLTSVPLAEVMLATFGWKGLFLVASGFVAFAILFLASLLMSCGRPIPTHMRRGVLAPGSSSRHSDQ